jgi:hypothetical protein
MTRFVPRLRRRIGEAATARILVTNPARLYEIRGAGADASPAPA